MIYSVIPTEIIMAHLPRPGYAHCVYARRGRAVVETIQGPRGRCVQRIYSTNPADFLDGRNSPGTLCRLPHQQLF